MDGLMLRGVGQSFCTSGVDELHERAANIPILDGALAQRFQVLVECGLVVAKVAALDRRVARHAACGYLVVELPDDMGLYVVAFRFFADGGNVFCTCVVADEELL